MCAPEIRRRSAFSLIELLVVIGIIGTLIGLLMPAVMRALESANRLRCANNMKQVVLGFHEAHDTHGYMPPGIGRYPQNNNQSYGTALFFVLPYVEQDNLFNLAEVDGYRYAGFNNANQQPIKVFLCPSDPTAGDGQVRINSTQTWGASSHCLNAQVFAHCDYFGILQDPEAYPEMVQTFGRNGTSNSILIAEKYARCTNRVRKEGGSLWAYSETGPSTVPLHAGFEISWTPDSIGPRSLFQLKPRWDQCDPTKASTAHRGGLNVGLADGSVRCLAPSISGDTWWAACAPQRESVLGPDW